MFFVPDFSESHIKVKLQVSLENATNYSSESSITLKVKFEACYRLFAVTFVYHPFFTFNKRLNSMLFSDLSLFFFKNPEKNKFHFFFNHFIDSLAGLSKLPILIATPHKFIEIFQLYLLFISYNLFQQIHKLRFLELMLFVIEDLLYVLILLKQIVVAKLTALYFVSY